MYSKRFKFTYYNMEEMIIYGKRKIHITVTEDYITSYGNLSVKFNKGDKIWDYKSDIFESNGNKMILAHDEVFGHIIGFISLNNTDFKSLYTEL